MSLWNDESWPVRFCLRLIISIALGGVALIPIAMIFSVLGFNKDFDGLLWLTITSIGVYIYIDNYKPPKK